MSAPDIPRDDYDEIPTPEEVVQATLDAYDGDEDWGVLHDTLIEMRVNAKDHQLRLQEIHLSADAIADHGTPFDKKIREIQGKAVNLEEWYGRYVDAIQDAIDDNWEDRPEEYR